MYYDNTLFMLLGDLSAHILLKANYITLPGPIS